MINWHHEPRSRKLIAKLQGRVEAVKRIGIPNDFYVFVGVDRKARHTLKALEARRTRAVERVAGAVFTDLKTTEQCRAYLGIDESAPCVYAVLAGEVA